MKSGMNYSHNDVSHKCDVLLLWAPILLLNALKAKLEAHKVSSYLSRPPTLILLPTRFYPPLRVCLPVSRPISTLHTHSALLSVFLVT